MKLPLKQLRRARKLNHTTLMSLPNVVGTALGQKRSSGEVVGERAVVVFVEKKLPQGELTSSQKIPSHFEIGGQIVATDVVTFTGWQNQQFQTPYSCHDDTQVGTVTTLAHRDGEAFGVSCAHCLTGPDADENSKDPIWLYDRENGDRLNVGSSAYCFKGPGHGGSGDFGFADFGLFTISEEPYRTKALNGEPLEVRQRVFDDQLVFAESSRGTIEGVVDTIEGVFDDRYVDLIINVFGEGTFAGDSGMLWQAENGAAVGIHAMGTIEEHGSGSRLSASMFAHRAQYFLNVDFVTTR